MKQIFGNPRDPLGNLQLLTLGHTLKTRTNFAVLQIVTTCDETKSQKDFSYPIRVTAKEFSYNWKTDRYEETIAFDRMVRCPDEALKFAVDRLHYNNVFERNGIDKDAYVNHENVLEVDAFRTEFNRFISAISENPNEPIIISNDNYAISNFSALDKIDCTEELRNMYKTHRVLSITDLTKAHFNEKAGGKGINYTITLDSVRQYLEKNGTTAIEANGKPLPEARIKTVVDFATYFGRYIHTFASKEAAEETLKIHNEIEAKIEGGKLKYRDSTLEEKLKTLEQMGQLSPEMLNRDSDCDLNKLLDIFEGKGASGIVLMQAATTGLPPRATPIQFTAAAFSVNEGKFNLEGFISMTMECASKSNLEYALQNKEYDYFANAGINREDYLNGKGVKKFDEATKKIAEFMSKYEDYAIVSNGKYFNNKRDSKTNISFTQGAMKSIGNFPFTSAPAIDFNSAFKAYVYRAHYSDKYDKNILFDEFKWGNTTFRLEELAKYHGQNIIGTRAKCEFMYDMLKLIAEQDIKLVKGEIHAEHIQPIDIDGRKAINKNIADELRASELPSEDSPIVIIEKVKENLAKEPDDIQLINISESLSSAYESPETKAEEHPKPDKQANQSEKDNDGEFIEADEVVSADITPTPNKEGNTSGTKQSVEAIKPQNEPAPVRKQEPVLPKVESQPKEMPQNAAEIEKQKKIERLKRLAGNVKIGNTTLEQSDDKVNIKEENGFAYIEKSEDDKLKDMVTSVLRKDTNLVKYEKADIERLTSKPEYIDAYKAVVESNKNKQVKLSNSGLSRSTFENMLDGDIIRVASNIDKGKSLLDGIIIEPKAEKPMEMPVEPTPAPVQQKEEVKIQEPAKQQPVQAPVEAPKPTAEHKQEPAPAPVPERVVERIIEKPASGMDAETTRMLANILAATNRQTDAIRGQTEAMREQANAEKDLLKLQISQSQNNIEALLAQNQAMTTVLREAVVQFSRAYTVVNEIALGRDISEQTNELLADVSEAMQNISRQLDRQKGTER